MTTGQHHSFSHFLTTYDVVLLDDFCVICMQIGDHVKSTMSSSLTDSYGVSFEEHTNRAITDAWDKAQERVWTNFFLLM